MTHDTTDTTDTTIYINKLEIGSVGIRGGSVGGTANGAAEPVDNTRAPARRWSDDPWCNMTTGEADAWREGFRAGQQAGWTKARGDAAAIARPPPWQAMTEADRDIREAVQWAIEALEPKA